MEVYFTQQFKKSLKKITSKNKVPASRFKDKFALFLDNPFTPTLKTHKLLGKLNTYWYYFR